MSRCLDTFSTINGQIHATKLKIPWFFLNDICMVIHLSDCCGKDNACSFIAKQGSFLFEYVDDIKMDGRKENMAPMWKKLMKLVDIDEPTSFLDLVYMGCAQRECKPNETIIEQYTKMYESHLSAGATIITRAAENITHKR